MSKGSRRREARRRAKQRRQEQGPERPPQGEGGEAAAAASPSQERPRGDEEPVRSEEAAGGRRGRADRKRAKRKDGFWERVGRIHVAPWMMVVPVLAVVGVVAVLIITSGSSGTTGGGVAPDPRVAGQTPTAEVSLSVDNINFSQTELSGSAGEVIEFVVTNTSSDRSHNMTFAGPDDNYDTSGDNFETDPRAIKEGETGRMVVKFDEPGTYRFRCSFHPNIEFGTLTLE